MPGDPCALRVEQLQPPDVAPLRVHDSAGLRAALQGECARGPCWIKLTGALYRGSFEVPPGTFLEGVLAQGIAPRIVGAQPGAVLHVPASQDACAVTTLRNLEVENEGSGISASGSGLVQIEGVRITVSRGVALLLDQLKHAILHSSVLRTPQTMTQLRDVPEEFSPSELPAVGLLANACEQLELFQPEVVGFVAYGVAVRDSALRWNQGHVHHNQGYGIFLAGEGTQATLEQVLVEDTLRSQRWREHPAVGLVLTQGARVHSQGLTSRRNQGVGILQDGAVATHRALDASDNLLPGYWLQRSQAPQPEPALTLEGASLERNLLAGLVGQRSQGVVLRRVEVQDTRVVQSFEDFDRRAFADGVQLVGIRGEVVLEEVTLRDNLRAGLILDAGEDHAQAQILLDTVSISLEAPGAGSYGLVVQGYQDALTLRGVEVDEPLRERDQGRSERLRVTEGSRAPSADAQTPWVGAAGLWDVRGVPSGQRRLGASGL